MVHVVQEMWDDSWILLREFWVDYGNCGMIIGIILTEPTRFGVYGRTLNESLLVNCLLAETHGCTIKDLDSDFLVGGLVAIFYFPIYWE